jgi:hypothetical protein
MLASESPTDRLTGACATVMEEMRKNLCNFVQETCRTPGQKNQEEKMFLQLKRREEKVEFRCGIPIG